MQIYLDYSATTPTRIEAQSLIQSILAQQWGNPSSLHEWGQRAATVMETARIQVANLINAPTPESIIFTSGGTEADNLAIMGVARLYCQPQHLIISSVEHSAISEPARILELWGWQVTRLGVDAKGRVNPQDLVDAIQDNTVLVSIIFGQSEIGTVQPIAQLGEICRRRGVLFHTDAVQVAGRLPIDVEMPVDLLSLSSHKIYGCQGAGALYLRPGVELMPLLLGGGQEMRSRSGTQAVAIIAGFGLAAELIAREMTTETPRLIELRDRLFSHLSDIPGLVPTGDLQYRLPHHVSVCFTSTDGEKINSRNLVRQMNQAGIGISAGSACNSGKLTPSPILLAMGYSDSFAASGVRMTLGKDTTQEDIDWTAYVFKQILARL